MSITAKTILASDGDADPTRLSSGSIPSVIEITGPINKKMIPPFRAALMQASATGQQVLPILISSPGGSVSVALQMADVLDSVSIPIATIAVGEAASAAAFILTAVGTRGLRYAAPSARIMFHEVSSATMGKISRQAASVDEGEVLNEALFDRINVMLGRDTSRGGSDFMQKLVAAEGHLDQYYSAQEAAASEFGFIDHDRIPAMLFDPRRSLFLFDGKGTQTLKAYRKQKERDIIAIREELYPSDTNARKAELVRRITGALPELSYAEVKDVHRQVRDQVGNKHAFKARKNVR